METTLWLPITDYAQRRGMSISTLRRKIKSNELDFKMEEGRYLIRCDAALPSDLEAGSFSSTDQLALTRVEVQEMIRVAKEEAALQGRAMEARVAGLSRKLEMFSEQISELKMLVKIFEEKMDARN